MNDTDLDERLSASIAPLPRAAREEAIRVAGALTPQRARKGRMPHPRWLAPFLIGGALALTAGAGTAAVTMSHWGGVGMPLENVRNEAPIRVSWTTDDGHREDCRVWIELRHPSPDDRDRLDAAIEARDWQGLGQQLYDATAPAADDEPDGESRVARGLTPVVEQFAEEVFPGIAWFGARVDEPVRGVDAWGVTCVPEAK